MIRRKVKTVSSKSPKAQRDGAWSEVRERATRSWRMAMGILQRAESSS